jgi:uncharacterized protein (TIGR02271 family)
MASDAGFAPWKVYEKEAVVEERSDRFTALEDRYAGYTVYDPNGEKIGKVDDLFVDENDQPEYIGVKMGFLGLRSTLIPAAVANIDEANERVEVSESKERVKDAPTFDDDKEITPEMEDEVHSYFGVQRSGSADAGERGAYGAYYGDEGTADEGVERQESAEGAAAGGFAHGDRPGVAMGDTDSGEFREHDPSEEGANEPESDLHDEDELRVQRSEEELRAGTREREAGRVNVRKRVRTERERIEVPKRREEVSVERVPVEGEAAEAEIGEDEINVPVTEEEVVTDKRAVAKEEIRVRKDAVEDTEVVEDEVRKEEVDVEDATERGRGSDRPENL